MSSSPFVRYVAALIAGILSYESSILDVKISYSLGLLGIGVYVISFFYSSSKKTPLFSLGKGVGALLFLVSLGWLTAYLHSDNQQTKHLTNLSDTLQAYEGTIAAQPEEKARTYRVELELLRGRTKHGWQPITGRVIVYLDKNKLALPTYGERWLVNGAPRPIDTPLNPGEFNYQRYLRHRNIYHQQYLRQHQRTIIGFTPSNRLTALAIQINQWADRAFTHHIKDRPAYAIVNAMLLGVRDDLDPELYRAYAAAGAIHILSVSGLHVGILFMVLTWVLGFLKKSPKGKWTLAVIQLSILWFYALITGFSPAVLRSAGMFTLLILAQAGNRPQQLGNTLSASAFFILLFSPFSLFSAGFQLSYLAVAGIGFLHPFLYQSFTFRYHWLNKLWELSAVALVAQLVTFPLGIYYFHQFPTYFLLANPMVIGLSNVLLPLAMLTLACSWIPGLNTLLGFLLEKTAWLLNSTVALTSRLPGAIQEGFWLSAIELLLLYGIIGCGALLVLQRTRMYLWGLACQSLLFGALLSFDYYQQAHQHRLAVHFLPHRTAISLTQGHQSTLLTDLDIAKDPRSFDFYLKNTFSSWGIKKLTIVRTDSLPYQRAVYHTKDYTLLIWQGKSLLLVNRLTGRNYWQLPAIVDYLIIRKNALQQWSQLDGRVVARHILFDDSNRTQLTDRLLTDARQRGVVCYAVRQQGAYVHEL